MDSPAPIFFLFIIVAIVGLMISRVMDSDRVKTHLEQRGGKLLEKRWNPFGRGWYGDNNRIYQVRYRDRDGNEHQAACKTSLFSGVYWTDDEIVQYAKRPERTIPLEEENARLRREIQRLKRESPETGEKA